MKVDLSIIVSIYNIEKYLKKAIDSLIIQKDYLYEIILVNDGSTDDCKYICNQYAQIYSDKIIIVNKENGGLPSARKAGLKVARGTYITFLDGDDWIDPDYYYEMLKLALEKNIDIVCGSLMLSYPDKEVEFKNTLTTGVYEGNILEQLKKQILYKAPYYKFGIMPSLCTKVIKKTLLYDYILSIPDNITLAEDAACSYPMLLSCSRLAILNENIGYHYRQRDSSMTYMYDPRKSDKILAVMDYLDTRFEFCFGKYSYQINRFYGQLLLDAVRNEMMSQDALRNKIKKLKPLLNRQYSKIALNDLIGISLPYRFFFELLRRRFFIILYIGYKCFKIIKKQSIKEK